jgi:hypothetical protein
MAVVLDATVGGVNANSFTDVAYANAYHENQLYSDAWTAAPVPTDAKKAQALITATQLIVNAFNSGGWIGWPATTVQRLPVPRSGMTYPNGAPIPNTIIPTQLQDATAEYAKRLLEAGALPDSVSDTESQSVGLKRMKAGSVELEFDHAGVDDSTDLPPAVFAMISFMFGRGSRQFTIPLVRS